MNAKKRDNNIMLLRIIAMIMVVTVHYNLIVDFPTRIAKIFAYGAKGVGVFLMFSGYLNMGSYDKIRSAKNFYVKKICNIIPLYYLALILNLILRCIFYHDISFNLPRVLCYFLGINMLIPSTEFYVWNNMGAVWTISVLLFFYFITPVIYKLIKSYKVAAVIFPFIYIGTVVIRKAMQIGLMQIEWVSEPVQFSNWFPVNLVVVYWVGILIYLAKKESKQHSVLVYMLCCTVLLFIIKKTDFVFWGILFGIVYLMMELLKVQFPDWGITIISTIDSYTFEIYLMHPIVLYIVEKQFVSIEMRTVTVLIFSLFFIILLAVIVKKIELLILDYSRHSRESG